MADAGRGQQRGRGTPRGGRGGTGRGAGGQGAAPLAAQMRQLDRLNEPKEMAILRHLKPIEALTVRSVYGISGLLGQEIQVPRRVLDGGPVAVGGTEENPYISLLQAEQLLSHKVEQERREIALRRRALRLPAPRHNVGWAQLTQEERHTLLMSNKDWAGLPAGDPRVVAAPKAPNVGPPAAG